MRNSGKMAFTLFLLGADGPLMFATASMADGDEKNAFATNARLLCIACAATVAIMALEVWVKTATRLQKVGPTGTEPSLRCVNFFCADSARGCIIPASLTAKRMQIYSMKANDQIIWRMFFGLLACRPLLALMKIAYLACCELFGDSFLEHPLNTEWQTAIRARTADEIEASKIHGWCFTDATEVVNNILHALAEHEHGIFVAVCQFGRELLTTSSQASETSNHGLLAQALAIADMRLKDWRDLPQAGQR